MNDHLVLSFTIADSIHNDLMDSLYTSMNNDVGEDYSGLTIATNDDTIYHHVSLDHIKDSDINRIITQLFKEHILNNVLVDDMMHRVYGLFFIMGQNIDNTTRIMFNGSLYIEKKLLHLIKLLYPNNVEDINTFNDFRYKHASENSEESTKTPIFSYISGDSNRNTTFRIWDGQYRLEQT